MKVLHTGIALILFASAATVAAQDVNVSAGPWFIGIGGGQSSLHGSCSYAESLSPPATCDDESVAVKAFVGMQVYKYTFLEFSYIDAGEANLVQSAAPTGTLDINPRLYNLFLEFEIPIAVGGRLGLLGKFGMTYFETKYTPGGSFTGIRGTDDGVSGAIGAGVTWHGWKHLSLRAEWEHFNNVSINDNDLDLATISLLFHF